MRNDFYNPPPLLNAANAMPATIITPAFPKLTLEEFAELLQRERAQGNPLALFAGSCIDPNDPEDKAFWAAVHEHRRKIEQQLQDMEDPQPQMTQDHDV